jgi:hypothetical protein
MMFLPEKSIGKAHRPRVHLVKGLVPAKDDVISRAIQECQVEDPYHPCAKAWPRDAELHCPYDKVTSCLRCALYASNREITLKIIKKETIRNLR